MKFLYDFPGRTVPVVSPLLSARAMTELAAAAERAGFSGVGLDDHPAPSEAWRQAPGGHDGIDPFLGLAAVAAGTEDLRLFTNLTIVPYRNPLLLAKAAATLDVLSQGRLTMGVGVGYLESEFSALGVDFALRNSLFDEAIDVCIRAWTGLPVTRDGLTFTADANTVQPRPTQDPHPPLWVGGNSQRSLQRAARFGQGWMAFPNPPGLTISRRSAELATLDDLGRLIESLRGYAAERGRTDAIDVGYLVRELPDGKPATRSLLTDLGSLGVTWVVWGSQATNMTDALADITHFRDVAIANQ